MSELVVISGNYQGKIKADSVWLTDSCVITGEINYKSLQMDRGAALNCKIVHNWDEKNLKLIEMIIKRILVIKRQETKLADISYINKDLVMEGTRVKEGQIVIAGQFKGNITAKSVVIENSAHVLGNVNSDP